MSVGFVSGGRVFPMNVVVFAVGVSVGHVLGMACTFPAEPEAAARAAGPPSWTVIALMAQELFHLPDRIDPNHLAQAVSEWFQMFAPQAIASLMVPDPPV